MKTSRISCKPPFLPLSSQRCGWCVKKTEMRWHFDTIMKLRIFFPLIFSACLWNYEKLSSIWGWQQCRKIFYRLFTTFFLYFLKYFLLFNLTVYLPVRVRAISPSPLCFYLTLKVQYVKFLVKKIQTSTKIIIRMWRHTNKKVN